MTKEKVRIYTIAIEAFEINNPNENWDDLSAKEKQSWYETAYVLAAPDPLKRYDHYTLLLQKSIEEGDTEGVRLLKLILDYIYYYALSEQDRSILDNRIY